MESRNTRKDTARAERIIPGIWRLRIPLPWAGVPHVNAFALTHGDGVVLVDTGTGPDGDARQLELALSQLGHGLEDVSLVVCTHSHADHYGLAKPVIEASGAPLWIHPAWAHVKKLVEDPHARREAIAAKSGVPEDELRRYHRNAGTVNWIAGFVEPDLDLLPGVTIDSDLGRWEVHETPGHAPSHVVLHQPERRLLISGDHLLGRVSVFFEYGTSEDPVGNYCASLDRLRGLDVDLVLAGHGRPFRDMDAKIGATRAQVEEHLNRTRSVLTGGPATAYDLMIRLMGPDTVPPGSAPYALQNILAYLDRLEALGEAETQKGSDPPIWCLT